MSLLSCSNWHFQIQWILGHFLMKSIPEFYNVSLRVFNIIFLKQIKYICLFPLYLIKVLPTIVFSNSLCFLELLCSLITKLKAILLLSATNFFLHKFLPTISSYVSDICLINYLYLLNTQLVSKKQYLLSITF